MIFCLQKCSLLAKVQQMNYSPRLNDRSRIIEEENPFKMAIIQQTILQTAQNCIPIILATYTEKNFTGKTKSDHTLQYGHPVNNWHFDERFCQHLQISSQQRRSRVVNYYSKQFMKLTMRRKIHRLFTFSGANQKFAYFLPKLPSAPPQNFTTCIHF